MAREEEEEDAHKGFGRSLIRKRHPPPPGVPQWKLESVGKLYKVWNFVIVCVPKIVVAGALAIVGGDYIVKSGDPETMFLNTLAVMFIIDVDELLYHAFTSDATKENLSHMQSVEVELSNRQRALMWFTNTVLYPLMVIVGTGALVFYPKFTLCDGYSLPNLPWNGGTVA